MKNRIVSAGETSTKTISYEHYEGIFSVEWARDCSYSCYFTHPYIKLKKLTCKPGYKYVNGECQVCAGSYGCQEREGIIP